jgi:AcrR family transcriptional regulator
VDQPESEARASRKPRGSRTRTPGLPGAGPGLPPTAQRLLDAARRLLARSGYNSLTVEAIGLEAKNGLLLALVDGLVSDTIYQARQRLSALSTREDRARVVVEILRAILDDAQSYRLLYDLLPRLLENPTMARQLAELYRTYRDLNTQALWSDPAEDAPVILRDVAAMTVALTDGLALQLLAEPGCVDIPSTLALWRSFVENVLASASGLLPDASPRDDRGDADPQSAGTIRQR